MLNVFENPAVIKSIYKEEIPSFDNIEIHEIKIINGEDLICYFRFDLNEYPSSPPLKWKQAGYNTSQINLTLIASQIITFDLKGKLTKGRLILEDNNKEKLVKFIQNNSSMPEVVIKCKWINIDGVSAYLK